MRRLVIVALGLVVVGCAAGPEVANDKSAVYGVVAARPHKDLLAKWSRPSADPYDMTSGATVEVPAAAIDYDRLTGIYVGLVDPRHAGGAVHHIAFSGSGAKPESLAVALGDVIRVRNATAHPLTIFLAATEGEAFQDIAAIPAGATGEVRVRIEGLLELGTDEDERLVAPVLARGGLRALAVASGGSYAFNDLDPGKYRMTFWHWRLGSLERSVDLAAGTATRVDEVLSVDRTVR